MKIITMCTKPGPCIRDKQEDCGQKACLYYELVVIEQEEQEQDEVS